MNNSISQDSIDSINEFIANYERERDARKAREEQARKYAFECALRKQTELENSFTYNLAMITKDILELAGNCLAGVAKITLAIAVMLSPYIIEAIIDKWLCL